MMSSLQPCGQRKMENHWTLKVLQLTFQVLLGLSSMVQQMMQVARFMKPSSMIVKPVKMSKTVLNNSSPTNAGLPVSKRRNFSRFNHERVMEDLMVSDIQQKFK